MNPALQLPHEDGIAVAANDTPVRDLRLNAAAAPQRTAIVCGGERMTYGELEAMANRIAAVLRSLGLVRERAEKEKAQRCSA